MQPQGLAAGLKDVLGFGMEFTRRDMFGDGFSGLEAGVDLDQGLWPIATAGEGLVDLVSDVIGANEGE